MTPNDSPSFSKPQVLLFSQLMEPLFYFDIFSYPLQAAEILEFSNLPKDCNLSEQNLKAALDSFVEKGYLYEKGGFYMLKNHPEWVTARIENNKRAISYLAKAKKMTRLMSCFPFVRAVFISGSLSKNVMPKDGDIDYFIVTKDNRLWICRTLLILFKKIFLLNSKKYFCVNYFVGESCLEIEEKNRFTATEVATLLPLYGKELYQEFWNRNQWVNGYYPRVERKAVELEEKKKRTLLQGILEPFFYGQWGDKLDAYLLKKTLKHWNKKFDNLDPIDFEIALKSKQNISKHHPQMFQQKVQKAFEERVLIFEKEHGLRLDI